ncbi:uncharacterized protein MELLADRAFT_65039 [Melampsora larici-populina 98AG31]|uniref:Uncharacterized protein n=1 Tax=Melampsora larici-populina (strain 98AG31 / pathotype 3-4-7) TaxID=747676 RepID=F4RTR9_MELLP|nr:uncharacterized protein MELLADRAFT_65039 [Melampsora larici-populina 98AG31]EGG04212.1 hypothetical protein MELLADRAFT_65039 [Melampsora larici-populina 98AG31]
MNNNYIEELPQYLDYRGFEGSFNNDIWMTQEVPEISPSPWWLHDNLNDWVAFSEYISLQKDPSYKIFDSKNRSHSMIPDTSNELPMSNIGSFNSQQFPGYAIHPQVDHMSTMVQAYPQQLFESSTSLERNQEDLSMWGRRYMDSKIKFEENKGLDFGHTPSILMHENVLNSGLDEGQRNDWDYYSPPINFNEVEKWNFHHSADIPFSLEHPPTEPIHQDHLSGFDQNFLNIVGNDLGYSQVKTYDTDTFLNNPLHIQCQTHSTFPPWVTSQSHMESQSILESIQTQEGGRNVLENNMNSGTSELLSNPHQSGQSLETAVPPVFKEVQGVLKLSSLQTFPEHAASDQTRTNPAALFQNWHNMELENNPNLILGSRLNQEDAKDKGGHRAIYFKEGLPFLCADPQGVPRKRLADLKMIPAIAPFMEKLKLFFDGSFKEKTDKMSSKIQSSVKARLELITYQFFLLQAKAKYTYEKHFGQDELEDTLERGYQWITNLWDSLPLDYMMFNNVKSDHDNVQHDDSIESFYQTVVYRLQRSDFLCRTQKYFCTRLLLQWIFEHNQVWLEKLLKYNDPIWWSKPAPCMPHPKCKVLFNQISRSEPLSNAEDNILFKY